MKTQDEDPGFCQDCGSTRITTDAPAGEKPCGSWGVTEKFSRKSDVVLPVEDSHSSQKGVGRYKPSFILTWNKSNRNAGSRVSSDAVLSRKLRNWRFSQSVERGVPAYLIFGNRTLEELVQQQPISIGELHHIFGLGQEKISDFGDDLMCLICEHINSSQSRPQDDFTHLLRSLKEVRADLAVLDKCPLYAIFSDSALVEFAKRKPDTKELMCRIPKIRRKGNFDKYSDQFLNTILEYKKKQILRAT